VRGLALRDLRRAVARHRALLAAGLAAAAVATGLSAVAPAAEEGVLVVTAARDLASGVPLTAEDLVAVSLPPALVPVGALVEPTAVVGRLVAGPVRRGEALTDVRLLGPGLLGPGGSSSSPPEGRLVAIPVRVAEAATAALVQAGDRVDVLSALTEGGSAASVVASGLTVLAVPTVGDGMGEGALLVLAADRTTAARLAAAAVTGRLSIAVLAPGARS